MAGAIGKGRMYGTTAQQKYVYTTKFCCHGIFRICLWHRLTAHLIRLGIVRGVGRHELPQRLKNHDSGERLAQILETIKRRRRDDIQIACHTVEVVAMEVYAKNGWRYHFRLYA